MTICLTIGPEVDFRAHVTTADASAFSFATDRSVEQLDQTLHLIYRRTRMDVDVPDFSGSWY